MIGLGPDVLTTDAGDVRARHLAYGHAVGRLTMIVSSFRRDRLRPASLSPELTIIPTDSRNRWTFIADAVRAGHRVCRESRVDLIVTQDPFATALVGYILKRRHRVPLLVGNHSQFLDNAHWIGERPVRYRLFNALGHRMIHAADALRVVNPAEREKYIRAGVRGDRISFIPTPVPLDRFLADVPPDVLQEIRLRLDARGALLLWVGNPAQIVKDLPTLFDAIAHVRAVFPETVLALAGDFAKSPHAELARLNQPASGLRFLGHVSHNALPAYYQAADLYVHSSRYEGLAKVMVEAAASGVPIVTTAVPGIEAIVDDGVTGLIAPIGDGRALADRILDLLRDGTRRHEMGRRARELARERFSRERQIAAIADMWRAVVDRSAKGRL